jgi:hypothetical protein
LKKALRGPHGVVLELDSKEIDVDDPGNGTPALVLFKGGVSTLNCAEGEGYVDGGRNGDIKLPQECLDWLSSDEIQKEVEDMYDAGPGGSW